jgi:hypothetical protein
LLPFNCLDLSAAGCWSSLYILATDEGLIWHFLAISLFENLIPFYNKYQSPCLCCDFSCVNHP